MRFSIIELCCETTRRIKTVNWSVKTTRVGSREYPTSRSYDPPDPEWGVPKSSKSTERTRMCRSLRGFPRRTPLFGLTPSWIDRRQTWYEPLQGNRFRFSIPVRVLVTPSLAVYSYTYSPTDQVTLRRSLRVPRTKDLGNFLTPFPHVLATRHPNPTPPPLRSSSYNWCKDNWSK